MAEEKVDIDEEKKNKRGGSIWSRVWNGIFRLKNNGDDFEKRLKYISKEEATLLARMKRRSSTWRSTARNLILFSVLLEFVVLAYAIITTRTVGLDWQMRALRVLPIFLLPAVSSLLYWALFRFTRMRDGRDQKTLDRLRAERQAKIDELKERTNYYTTQQLIQKYDPDPAAKAAAASVLASKLGADSGPKVFLGDESPHSPEATGKSHDVEPLKSSGLRKRNTSEATFKGGNDMEMLSYVEDEVSPHGQVVVEHHNPAAFGSQDGGWLARLAQLLVGEDPSQSYALICGNCHMHNGLARKEDFPFITYYCPRCHALNRPRNSVPSSPNTNTHVVTSPNTTTHAVTSPTMEGSDVSLIKQNSGSMKTSPISSPVAEALYMSEKLSATNSLVSEVVHMSQKVSATSTPVADDVHMSDKVSASSSLTGEMEASEKIVAV
uniref:uncharacterized protein At2g24330-like n=1 Tax=Erigeron canadensis TaxID=72917 RepID=UPI001CB973D5|nr:uncharacterized protein At2g24330-like [Erigeron canadensis]